MVLQKRSNYGFNGYQIPAMPRGSRSARGRRRWGTKSVEDNQMHAFELLATVAGSLLLEQENSPGTNPRSPPAKDLVKKEQQLGDDKKPIKLEPSDQGSCDEGTLIWKQSPQLSTSRGGHPSTTAIVKPDVSGKATGLDKGSKLQNSAELPEKKVELPIGFPSQVKKENGGDGWIGTVPSLLCIGNPMDFESSKPPPLVSSDSSVEVSQHRNHVNYSYFPRYKGDAQMMNADYNDEENSSACTQPNGLLSRHFKTQKLGDRRIKKITPAKFWKVGPTLLKDGEFYNDAEPKPLFRNRKMCCTRRRTQRSSFKRRQLFMKSSVSGGLGGRSEEVVYKTLEKGIQAGADGSGAHLRASMVWPSLANPKLSSKSEDYKVKLRIKSFKVPELFIEMSETATVGSLKRTVLETVSTMLVNGFRVGVIFQGKKVGDDNKTLLQAGIAHGDKQLDSVGFTLEPNPSKAPQQQLSCPRDPHLLRSPQSLSPSSRIPAITTWEPTLAVASSSDDYSSVPPPDHRRCCHSPRPLAIVEPPPAPTGNNSPTPRSKALASVPSGVGDQPLALVPSSHRKSKRSEFVQRRIRRPFTVAEVEALVQAVEDLGTGRWRDVKIRAFENVKHRTYVDLKWMTDVSNVSYQDKWKTLVHTAGISPQQRRGEPVPQELLDRVLSAHARWSNQQVKLQA